LIHRGLSQSERIAIKSRPKLIITGARSPKLNPDMGHLRPSNFFLQPVATITLHFDQPHTPRRHENKFLATEERYSAQKK
jgi:hypothetical protein